MEATQNFRLGWAGTLAIVAIWVITSIVKKSIDLRRAFDAIKRYPGGSILWLTPIRPLSILLCRWWPPTGRIGALKNKFSIYEKYGSTCLSSVTFWDLRPHFWIADADVIKTITSDSNTFPKDITAYKALSVYGENIVGTEGTNWKKHRAVARPAFNKANNGFVWSESIHTINEWFDQLDLSNADPSSDITFNALSAMTQLTLLVISAAGFGRRWSWATDFTEAPPGYRYSFPFALQSALDGHHVRALTPVWFYKLSQKIYLPFLSHRLKMIYLAYDDLRLHILELISTARAWVLRDRSSELDAALIRNLVEANMAQEGDSKALTDDELLSNSFIFLLAGHETSSHSLAFAVSLLALYPDVQYKLYEEVVGVWPTGIPTSSAISDYKNDYPKLRYTLAVFYETLRFFPSVSQIPRLVQYDTVLTAKRFTNGPNKHQVLGEFRMNVPARSVVVLDILGTHMNPLYWGEDVDDFKPERFIDTDTYRWPRDAFLTFSQGPRNCIGQQFALTECVCVLASIVRRYEILVPQHLESLSHEDQKKEMLHWVKLVTMTPSHSRLRLRRRS